MGFTLHKGIIHEPAVFSGIRHHQGFGIEDGVGTKRKFPRDFRHSQSLAGFKPNPVFVNQGDQSDGNIEYALGKPGDPVEAFLGGGIEKVKTF
jgi:hypothetical protein